MRHVSGVALLCAPGPCCARLLRCAQRAASCFSGGVRCRRQSARFARARGARHLQAAAGLAARPAHVWRRQRSAPRCVGQRQRSRPRRAACACAARHRLTRRCRLVGRPLRTRACWLRSQIAHSPPRTWKWWLSSQPTRRRRESAPRPAALEGDLIDLTALSSDEGEDAPVTRGDVLGASPAAADAVAAAELGPPRRLSAAAAGGADVVSSLLQQGPDAGSADRDGSTALRCASRDDHVEATEAVLESGTSASRKDKGGDTPVHGAAVDLRHRSGVHAALFALMDSLQTGDDPVALRGLVEGDNSPLCDAVDHNELLAMKYLVMRGCAGIARAVARTAASRSASSASGVTAPRPSSSRRPSSSSASSPSFPRRGRTR